ncbi:hypothetical protein C8R44DRAFT_873206 [Mycena epipterygia]|nr:hypothetical protein C8R44DRAFT_873206 [Mycena epipterygia]
MHDSLLLKNISRLPFSIRGVATAAANGSVKDLRDLCDILRNNSTEQTLLSLPVFYANLDPAGIPIIDELDKTAADRAMASIGGLCLSLPFISISALRDFWPRYWAWAEYLHPYIVTAEPEREDEFCQSLLVLLARLTSDVTLANLLATTPGVRTLLVRAWCSILQWNNSRERIAGLECVVICIVGPLDASQPAGLEEYVDGVDGDIAEFSFLLVETIATLVPSRRSPHPSAKVVKLLHGILRFVIVTGHAYDHESDSSSQPLFGVLSKSELAAALTITIDNLGGIIDSLGDSTTSGPTYELALDDCFALLTLTFKGVYRNLCLAEALENGLLHAMLTCGNRPPSSRVHAHLKSLLEAVLPMSLMSYPVVFEIEDAMVDIKEVVGTSMLAKTTMWQNFIDLAVDRAAVLRPLQSPGFIWPAACANMECGVMRSKKTLKRCSGCKSVYYCSRRCQILDWRGGGHRSICSPHLILSLNEHQDVSRRERIFLRAVLQFDYQMRSAEDVYPAQAMFMRQFPREGFYTLFDYTSGRAKIDVQSAVHSPLAKRFQDIGLEWASAVSRALNSEGRMELHVMQLIEVGTPRYWLIPLRSESSKLYTGLTRIAAALPSPSFASPQEEILPSLIANVLDEAELFTIH